VRATLKQIAEAAGVSRGTVDRALHDRKGVNPEVAAHIKKVAKRMGYNPNRAGQLLAASKKSLLFGCMLPSVGNPFFDAVIEGIRQKEKELSDFGLSIQLEPVVGFDQETHLAAIHRLLAQRPDALIISTVNVPPIQELAVQAARKGIPVCALNSDIENAERLFYVGPDYLQSGRTAAGLLLRMRPPALILLIVTGSLSMKGHNQRIQGFSQTVRQSGIPYDVADVVESNDNDQVSYKKTREVLAIHPDINCIYIAAAGAAGVCRAVEEAGRTEDLILLSCDDIPSTRAYMERGIIDFTICQDPFQQGQLSVELMFDYLIRSRREPPIDQFTNTVIKIKENL